MSPDNQYLLLGCICIMMPIRPCLLLLLPLLPLLLLQVLEGLHPVLVTPGF